MNFTMSGTLLIGVSPNYTPSAANAEDVSPAMTAIKIKHFLIMIVLPFNELKMLRSRIILAQNLLKTTLLRHVPARASCFSKGGFIPMLTFYCYCGFIDYTRVEPY